MILYTSMPLRTYIDRKKEVLVSILLGCFLIFSPDCVWGLVKAWLLFASHDFFFLENGVETVRNSM